MNRDVFSEVLRTTLIGATISLPLKYYLLKHHVDEPAQNAVILTVWSLVVGHYLFRESQQRLAKNPPLPLY